MKLTAPKINWINNRVKKYCSLLNADVPTLLLTSTEYNNFKKNRRKFIGHRVGRIPSKYFGVCHRFEKVIFLNVKKHYNLNTLDDTIRHELIHYAKPSYNHCSITFHNRMKQLKKNKVKNGRFYK